MAGFALAEDGSSRVACPACSEPIRPFLKLSFPPVVGDGPASVAPEGSSPAAGAVSASSFEASLLGTDGRPRSQSSGEVLLVQMINPLSLRQSIKTVMASAKSRERDRDKRPSAAGPHGGQLGGAKGEAGASSHGELPARLTSVADVARLTGGARLSPVLTVRQTPTLLWNVFWYFATRGGATDGPFAAKGYLPYMFLFSDEDAVADYLPSAYLPVAHPALAAHAAGVGRRSVTPMYWLSQPSGDSWELVRVYQQQARPDAPAAPASPVLGGATAPVTTVPPVQGSPRAGPTLCIAPATPDRSSAGGRAVDASDALVSPIQVIAEGMAEGSPVMPAAMAAAAPAATAALQAAFPTGTPSSSSYPSSSTPLPGPPALEGHQRSLSAVSMSSSASLSTRDNEDSLAATLVLDPAVAAEFPHIAACFGSVRRQRASASPADLVECAALAPGPLGQHICMLLRNVTGGKPVQVAAKEFLTFRGMLASLEPEVVMREEGFFFRSMYTQLRRCDPRGRSAREFTLEYRSALEWLDDTVRRQKQALVALSNRIMRHAEREVEEGRLQDDLRFTQSLQQQLSRLDACPTPVYVDALAAAEAIWVCTRKRTAAKSEVAANAAAEASAGSHRGGTFAKPTHRRPLPGSFGSRPGMTHATLVQSVPSSSGAVAGTAAAVATPGAATPALSELDASSVDMSVSRTAFSAATNDQSVADGEDGPAPSPPQTPRSSVRDGPLDSAPDAVSATAGAAQRADPASLLSPTAAPEPKPVRRSPAGTAEARATPQDDLVCKLAVFLLDLESVVSGVSWGPIRPAFSAAGLPSSSPGSVLIHAQAAAAAAATSFASLGAAGDVSDALATSGIRTPDEAAALLASCAAYSGTVEAARLVVIPSLPPASEAFGAQATTPLSAFVRTPAGTTGVVSGQTGSVFSVRVPPPPAPSATYVASTRRSFDAALGSTQHSGFASDKSPGDPNGGLSPLPMGMELALRRAGRTLPLVGGLLVPQPIATKDAAVAVGSAGCDNGPVPVSPLLVPGPEWLRVLARCRDLLIARVGSAALPRPCVLWLPAFPDENLNPQLGRGKENRDARLRIAGRSGLAALQLQQQQLQRMRASAADAGRRPSIGGRRPSLNVTPSRRASLVTVQTSGPSSGSAPAVPEESLPSASVVPGPIVEAKVGELEIADPAPDASNPHASQTLSNGNDPSDAAAAASLRSSSPAAWPSLAEVLSVESRRRRRSTVSGGSRWSLSREASLPFAAAPVARDNSGHVFAEWELDDFADSFRRHCETIGFAAASSQSLDAPPASSNGPIVFLVTAPLSAYLAAAEYEVRSKRVGGTVAPVPESPAAAADGLLPPTADDGARKARAMSPAAAQGVALDHVARGERILSDHLMPVNANTLPGNACIIPQADVEASRRALQAASQPVLTATDSKQDAVVAASTSGSLQVIADTCLAWLNRAYESWLLSEAPTVSPVLEEYPAAGKAFADAPHDPAATLDSHNDDGADVLAAAAAASVLPLSIGDAQQQAQLPTDDLLGRPSEEKFVAGPDDTPITAAEEDDEEVDARILDDLEALDGKERKRAESMQVAIPREGQFSGQQEQDDEGIEFHDAE